MKIKAPYFLLILLNHLVISGCGNQEVKESKIENKDSLSTKKLFHQIPANKSNIDFINRLTESESDNIIKLHYFYNGGGVACGDINNDGLIDIYFTANQLPDKLFLNKGNMEFEDISDGLPRLNTNTWSTGVTMADVNQDGLLDIYVCKAGSLKPFDRKNQLLINQGDLSFKDEAESFGLADQAYSTQASFFDYDKDGDLDMFLLNHEIKDINNYNKEVRAKSRNQDVGDKLYRNDNNTFVDVSEAAGIWGNPYGFGLGVSIGDLNNDGWPDIYVSNDFLENDYLYFNNQDGSFEESIKSATKHISNYGMGTDIADINNDGYPEIMVVDMVAKDNFRQKTNMSGMNPKRFWQTIDFGFHYQYMYNSLQLNQGDKKFSEIGQLAGVSSTDWSWALLMVDLDNDGLKDIVVSNGIRKEVRNNDFVRNYILNAEQMPKFRGQSPSSILKTQLENLPSKRVANYAFKNTKNLNFTDKSVDWGLNTPSFSTGLAYADLDNDGDLDLVMNNVDDTAFVFKNTSREQNLNNYIHITLKGKKGNLNGVGSNVVLYSSKSSQYQEVHHTRGFQSSVPATAYFGIGDLKKIDSIHVFWPNNRVSKLVNPSINQSILVDIKTSIPVKTNKDIDNPVFLDISKKHDIDITHQENNYDDFKDQVLLPHKLSTQGPAIAVGDINGDGIDDIYVGGSKNYEAVVYLQNNKAKFSRKSIEAFKKHSYFEDTDAMFIDIDNDSDLDLYVCSGGYEFNINSDSLQDRIYINDGSGNFNYSPESLPKFNESTSKVKPFDFDNDGDLDLFVGGRLVPKSYPLAPNSYLLENNNGNYTNVTPTVIPELKSIGMVTDAEWMDINKDNKIDLVIAGEWMPITVFIGENNKFKMADQKSIGLDYSDGWWYSLQKVDIDQDGDMDLIAGNLGLNYKYKASKEKPFKVFGKDFDNNDTIDIVLSYSQEGVYYPVRGRECSSDQLSFIKDKYPDYNSFGRASVYDILGENNIKDSTENNAYTFATSIFKNNEGNFQMIELSNQVQLSSINDIVVDDINNDGFKDVIMAGNLYSSEVETPRNDAGYGNILIGNGTENFTYLDPRATSFFGEGDVKNITPISLNDGKKAYLVAQNSGAIRLFYFSNQNEAL